MGRPLLVSGVQFEVTGKELKARFEQRVKEVEVFVENKGVIKFPQKVIDRARTKLNNYKFYATHINPDYVYHLSGNDLNTYEMVNSEEDILSGTIH